MTHTVIRPLQAPDVELLVTAMRGHGPHHTTELYERYLSEHKSGERLVLVAFDRETLAGYLTVQWRSGYPSFQAARIPETRDFNVFPAFRRRRIGTRLMDEAERSIARRSPVAGIGVGLSSGYGAAQRMYAPRGYVPDGRGATLDGRLVRDGESLPIHDLIIHMTKRLDRRGSLRTVALQKEVETSAETGFPIESRANATAC